jgi:hypothetical protein
MASPSLIAAVSEPTVTVPEPKKFWRIPAGDHVEGLKVAGQEYERRVSQFFENSLR